MKFKDDKEREQIFHKLYHQFSSPIYRAISLMTNNANFVDDILQESFIIVYQKLHQLKDLEKAKSWISIIAYHVTDQYLKRFKNNRLVFCEDVLLLGLENNVSSFSDINMSIENEYVLHESFMNILQALHVLSPPDAQLVIMKYYFEMKYSEISDILNQNPLLLKWKMPQIKKKLAKEFRNIRGGDSDEKMGKRI